MLVFLSLYIPDGLHWVALCPALRWNTIHWWVFWPQIHPSTAIPSPSTSLVPSLNLPEQPRYSHLTEHSVQFNSVAQSCLTLCDPMDSSTPGFPVHHQLPELAQTQSIKSVMPSKHLIFCRPLFLLSSSFSSIRVSSNESVLCIRWPKYWSFSFSIIPSNKHSGLMSLRIDWFDLLLVMNLILKVDWMCTSFWSLLFSS